MVSIFMLLAWIASLRLKTLPLALSSILVGNSLAYWYQHLYLTTKINSWVFVLTLLTAICLQILSNLANDYGDAIKKVDDENRIGPLRGIQTGQISLSALKKSLFICSFLAILLGSCLLFIAVQTIQDLLIFLLLGALSILAAITYTVGKKPYGYFGFGDLSVFIFFGLVAVIGSFYLQTHIFYFPILLPACAFGFLATAVLNMNNLRDYQSDKKHHKRTFIVILGQNKACYYQVFLIVATFIALALFEFIYIKSDFGWLLLVIVPLIYFHLKAVFRDRYSAKIARQLINVIKMTLLTTFLFCFVLFFSYSDFVTQL